MADISGGQFLDETPLADPAPPAATRGRREQKPSPPERQLLDKQPGGGRGPRHLLLNTTYFKSKTFPLTFGVTSVAGANKVDDYMRSWMTRPDCTLFRRAKDKKMAARNNI